MKFREIQVPGVPILWIWSPGMRNFREISEFSELRVSVFGFSCFFPPHPFPDSAVIPPSHHSLQIPILKKKIRRRRRRIFLSRSSRSEDTERRQVKQPSTRQKSSRLTFSTSTKFRNSTVLPYFFRFCGVARIVGVPLGR